MTEEASSSSKDVSMTGTHSEPSVLPKDEPKFGGYTRFEIELEVTHTFHMLTAHLPRRLTNFVQVRPMPRPPAIPQSSRCTKILRWPCLCRIPQILTILVTSAIHKVPTVSRTDTEELGVVAAGEVSKGDFEPALGSCVDGGGRQGCCSTGRNELRCGKK